MRTECLPLIDWLTPHCCERTCAGWGLWRADSKRRLQTVPTECGESIIWLLFFSVNKQSKAPLCRELELYLFWRWILSSHYWQRVWAFLWEVVFAHVKRKRVHHHSRSVSHVSEVSEKLAVAKLKYKHQTASFAASLFGNNSKYSSQSSEDTSRKTPLSVPMLGVKSINLISEYNNTTNPGSMKPKNLYIFLIAGDW